MRQNTAVPRGRFAHEPTSCCYLDDLASGCRSAVRGLGRFALATTGSCYRFGTARMAQTSGDGTAFGRRCSCSTLPRNNQYTGYYPNQVRRSRSLPLCAKPNVSGGCDNDVWVSSLLSVHFDFALFCDSIPGSARNRGLLGRALFGEAVRRELSTIQAPR